MPKPEPSALPSSSAGAETDLAELAALFAAHSGGNVSQEISADLALEIVLNEIVEQACLATGATGAAVILEREGEMVCRARSGVNVPQLGARLDSETGLTAECIKTGQMQRCDDALTDPRADAEASRSLGVRSVMVFPLLWNAKLAGVLEVFSSRCGAFRERDEHTLQALAGRILKNLEQASRQTTRVVGSTGGHSDSAPSAAETQPPQAGPVLVANDREISRAALPTNVDETSSNQGDRTILNREDTTVLKEIGNERAFRCRITRDRELEGGGQGEARGRGAGQ
jgi:signal transduction protein with GAF and PtsI domain